MATLEKIRSKAGLLVGVVGIALFAFIIGDFLRSGSTFFNQSKEKVAVVDGHSIDIREFQTRQETAVNNYKNRMGGSLTEEQHNQVRQMVYEQMIGSILLKEKSEKIGLSVGREELTDLVMGNNISPYIQQMQDFQDPQTGAFDRNTLLNFLQLINNEEDWEMYPEEYQQQFQRQKEIWLDVLKSVSEQQLHYKFSTLLTSAIAANSVDAKAAFNDNVISVDFDYASQLFNTIPDSEIEVTNAEIAKLYESRKAGFRQDHAKVISYIAVSVVPSETDFANVAARMEELKVELANSDNPIDVINENSDEFFQDVYISIDQLNADLKNFVEHASVGDIEGPVLTNRTYGLYKLIDVKQAPDSVKINQIPLPFTDEAQTKIIVDSLIREIRSGKTFAEVALAGTNGQYDGDIGWQTELSLSNSGVNFPDLNVFFNAKIDELFTVRSSQGIHLMQIVEKTKPVTKFKVGAIRKEVIYSQETYNKLFSGLNQFISKNRNLERFQSAASEEGFFIQTGVEVFENQANLSSIENSRQVIKWAFNSKKGDVSDIFECQDYLITAAVEGSLKEGFRSLADVSDILKRELINEKKGIRIVEMLNAKNLNSLEGYASAMNSNIQEVKFVTFSASRIPSGIGVDPIVNARALASEAGLLTGPFAGRNAVYVISVTNRTKVDEQAYDEGNQKQQMNMQSSYRIMQMVQDFSLLKENVNIEDNRSRFY